MSFFTENRTREEAGRLDGQRREDARKFYDKYHHTFIDVHCPVCGRANDVTASGMIFESRYRVIWCDACACQYVNPRPTQDSLREYYSEYPSSQLLRDLYDRREIQDDDIRIRMVTDRMLDKSDKICEIGCGNGRFLDALARQGYGLLYGYDLDNTSKYSKEVGDHHFQVLCHFEVIEHMTDPFTFLLWARQHSSYMVFSTPNATGTEHIAAPFWRPRILAHAIYPPMHLQGFSVTNITHMLLRAGFGIRSLTTPGKYDVDLLGQTKEYAAFRDCLKGERILVQRALVEGLASTHMMVVACPIQPTGKDASLCMASK
jgi:hypothetical protein